MYLTFSSAICPQSCLPSVLPLASFASNLGASNPTGEMYAKGHAFRSVTFTYILIFLKSEIENSADVVMKWIYI